MTEYIKDDLAARLRVGQDLPAQLTLDSLAEYYQVSFTPVRIAVAELIEDGLLEKGANRRLTVITRRGGRRARGKTPILPRPPRDAFQFISNDLVRLSLKGEAVYLREEATAEEYNISRSAIRNIFHRLAGVGMLDHVPRRGWRLRPFRQEDLRAFNDVREVLELKALELARPRLVNDDLQAMFDANVVPTSDDVQPVVDNTLHAYVIEKAGNHYIKDFFERQGRYYEILFHWEVLDRPSAIETARQHRDILSALLRRDWREARNALSRHICGNHPILSQVVPQVQNANPC